jgi:hypothetical protein
MLDYTDRHIRAKRRGIIFIGGEDFFMQATR